MTFNRLATLLEFHKPLNRFLLEANSEKRIEFLISKYSEKLRTLFLGYYKVFGENPRVIHNQTETDNIDIIVPELIRYIVLNVDPQLGTYSEWIVKSIIPGKNRNAPQFHLLSRLAEDWYKVKQDLELYHQNKRLLRQNPELSKFVDINAVDGFSGLVKLVDDMRDDIDVEAEKSEMKAREKEVDKIYNSDNFLILTPKTKEASCAYGRGTRWCTAATGSYNYFDSYSRQGPLYIIIDKIRGKKFQLHFQSGQYMDEDDYEISLGKFEDRHYAEIQKPLAELAIENEKISAAIDVFPKIVDEYLEIDDLHTLSSIISDPIGFRRILRKKPDLINTLFEKKGELSIRYQEESNTFDIQTTYDLDDMADMFIKPPRYGSNNVTKRILNGDYNDDYDYSSDMELGELLAFLDESRVENIVSHIIDYYSIDTDEETYFETPTSVLELESFLETYDSESVIKEDLSNAYNRLRETLLIDEYYKIAIKAITDSLPVANFRFNGAGQVGLSNIPSINFTQMISVAMETDREFYVNANYLLQNYAATLAESDELIAPDYDNVYVDTNSRNPEHRAWFEDSLDVRW